MKYWYLKGGDVLGPITAAEIMKDSDFSTDSLVCPENESNNQAAWRSPLDYPDFAGLLSSDKNAAPASLIDELSPEDTIHARSPLNASLENNLLDDLPARAVLATAVAPKQAAPKPAQPSPAEPEFSDTELANVFTETRPEPFSEAAFTPPPAPAQPKPVEQKPQPAPQPQNPSPEPPPETFTQQSAVVLKSNDLPPAVQPCPQPGATGNNKAENSFFSSMEEEAPPADNDTYPLNANIQTQKYNEVASIFSRHTLDPDDSAACIKVSPSGTGALPTTTGKIINAMPSPYDTQPPKKKDKIFLLMLIMFIVIAAALFILFKHNMQPAAQPPAAQPQRITQEDEAAQAMQGIAEGIAAPNVRTPQAVKMPGLSQQAGTIALNAPEDATAKMMAQRMVREYLLDERRGTVEEFFKNTYGDYKTFWTADHLHENTYVVEFSASKVRQEPIKYLFRIDIKNRQLVGMNNITMDLIK